MKSNDEFYVSVDIETSGPIPGEYSMLSIGACLVSDPKRSLYLTLQPDGVKCDPEALAVTGLDLDTLAREGLTPLNAMAELDKWLTSVCPPGKKAIFVGLNAPFDWSFVNYYFHKYLGKNPFGFTAIDIKAYFMGATGSRWGETKSSRMSAILKPCSEPSHNALDDARFQAELFALMLANWDNAKKNHGNCKKLL
ncbi:3'-5' exonuclease [Serratia entomophila]|uniref:3'-5' exonuclease n=1 Tax=Serratia entomophila TaxID=42906 RepID=UPI00217B2B6E|nr:3'-5' exonuclease [Serratia entomophila]CAI0822988.1 Ribonuclease T [Serratia entomophila]CAI1540278.1 Ribonuclease T [Serratia entomophila]CAI1549149.1 Ribonuclease T [Serratia entomophila]CAI1636010.1 Ribonuclease T [Serratia entomophila]CAI1662102.1 Ribonuclease T [Serratia entomophila]